MSKYKLPPLLAVSEPPTLRTSSDGGVSNRTLQLESSVLSVMGSPRVNSTSQVASPKASLPPGSPRTPSSRFEDPMLTWRSRSNTVPSPAGPDAAHSPSGVALTASPSFRSPVSAPFSQVRSGRHSLGGNSYMPSSNVDGTISASSSRRQSMNGGTTPPTDTSAPWNMRVSNYGSDIGDDDDDQISYHNSERPSPSNPSGWSAAGGMFPQPASGGPGSASRSSVGGSSTGVTSTGAIGPCSGGSGSGSGNGGAGNNDPMSDLVGRRHSYQQMQRPDVGVTPSMMLTGRQATSMRYTDEDDFLKRLQQHRGSWRGRGNSGVAGLGGGGGGGGGGEQGGLQHKTHEALKQLLEEMKTNSFRDRRISSSGGGAAATSSLLAATTSFKLGSSHQQQQQQQQQHQQSLSPPHHQQQGECNAAGAGSGGTGSGGGGGNSSSSQPSRLSMGSGYGSPSAAAAAAAGGVAALSLSPPSEPPEGILIGTSPTSAGPMSSMLAAEGLRRPPLAPGGRPQALHQSYDL